MARITTPKSEYTFDYPVAIEFADKQMEIFWLHDEIDVEKDVQDLKTNFSKAEYHGVITTLKLFTLYELFVGTEYWGGKVMKAFPRADIQRMANCFSFFELCLAPETEVLTMNKGWVTLKNYELTDGPVAQWDSVSKSITWETPSRKVKSKTDKFIRFYTKKNTYEQIVTPGHRMPVMDRKGEVSFVESDKVKYHGYNSAPLSGMLEGPERKITWLEKFFIATQADGSILKRYDGSIAGTRPIHFFIKKDRKKNRLREILSNLDFKYKEVIYDKKPGYSTFKVDVPVDITEKTDLKSFDWVKLAEINGAWCQDFLEELKHWDSHIYKDGDVFVYDNTCTKSVDKVQIISSLAGMCCSISKVGRKTQKDLYRCHITKRDKNSGSAIRKEEIFNPGDAYCLTVPSGAFMIRSSGRVSITGNCVHAPFYNKINEVMGLATDEFYNSYIDDPILKNRIDWIEEQVAQEDLLKSLGVFSMMEGAILFSSFAFLKHFQSQGKNKLVNICSGINFSVRDENLHCQGGSWLYRTLKQELGAEDQYDYFVSVAEKIALHEDRITDMIFEKGEILGITADQIKAFVRHRLDTCLEYLGYEKHFNPECKAIKEWFYDNVNTSYFNDFFSRMGNQYNRKWSRTKFVW